MVSIIRYRNATVGDVEAVAGLHADSWRRNYRGAFSDSFLDGDVVTDRLTVWAQRLARPGPEDRTIIAESGVVVVGFAHVMFDDHPRWGALLDNLHVAHHMKRRAVGRNLMGRTAQAVVEHDPSAGLYLWVLAQNTAAQAFYGALGGSCVEHGFAQPPGGGRPARLRYVWPDPSVLVT